MAQFYPSNDKRLTCRHLANPHRPLMFGAPFPDIIQCETELGSLNF